MIERLHGFRKRDLVAITGILAAIAAVVVGGVQLFHRIFDNDVSVEHLMRTKDERHVAVYLALAAKEEARHIFERMDGRIFMIEPADNLLDRESSLAFTKNLIEYPGSADVLGSSFILNLQLYMGLMNLTIDRMNLMHKENRPIGSLVAEVHDLSSLMFEKICVRLLQLQGIRYGEFRDYQDARTYLTKLEGLGCLL